MKMSLNFCISAKRPPAASAVYAQRSDNDRFDILVRQVVGDLPSQDTIFEHRVDTATLLVSPRKKNNSGPVEVRPPDIRSFEPGPGL